MFNEMLHNLKNVFYFILLFSFVNCSQDLYCRDENNQFVDWYVNYKLPKIEKGYSGTYLSEGKAYTYITSNIPEYWALSSNSINSNASMLGYTVQHLFNVQKKTSYLLYNDEPPFDNGTAIGHLKGIVAFDGTSGFWIVHSIPKFTGIDKYEYPSNALENGQSILCMSFPASALNAICNQLLFSHPKIYKYGITDEVLGLLDDKARTIFSKNPNFVHKPPFESNVALKSINQKSFVSFAKDNQLVEDLYSKIVAPALGTSLATETWRRGSGGYLPPSCESKYLVLNIESINMTISDINIVFKSTEDHSKWAVSMDNSKPWICIGDINRMKSQGKRGGGTVCFESKQVWQAYSSVISNTDKCPVT
ncbi:deoxyribonuclease-2 [Parasteatoda tepidariorum]|uniref:deoxyribonuclease-2 n=1 Tax=Parasteatoda tepidariorum TaxID=114398 RepID=UPI00077FE104|nr:deoxyribonuclease-2 [Parasteatoda tepidariorum]